MNGSGRVPAIELCGMIPDVGAGLRVVTSWGRENIVQSLWSSSELTFCLGKSRPFARIKLIWNIRIVSSDVSDPLKNGAKYFSAI
jgi:hypothetical protein